MKQPILLVDDDPDDAELFRLAAGRAGILHPLRIAVTGMEALDLLLEKRLSPVVTLLDVNMPGLGGLEVLRRLRGHPSMKNLVVMMLTSSELERDQLDARKLGCSLYFVKPSTFPGYLELAERIKALLP
jgi:CheY-like chemotaxis protein